MPNRPSPKRTPSSTKPLERRTPRGKETKPTAPQKATLKEPSPSSLYYQTHPEAQKKKRAYNKQYHRDLSERTKKEEGVSATTLYYNTHPEALKKKQEYRKKYNAQPEQVAYRVELKRINRQLGTYGNGDGLDVSHTTNKKSFTLEEASKNRARNGSGTTAKKLKAGSVPDNLKITVRKNKVVKK
jgi:hypothetical protein